MFRPFKDKALLTVDFKALLTVDFKALLTVDFKALLTVDFKALLTVDFKVLIQSQLEYIQAISLSQLAITDKLAQQNDGTHP